MPIVINPKASHCDICLDNYNSTSVKPIVLPCGHFLCGTCAFSIENRCPLCRQRFRSHEKTEVHVDYDVDPKPERRHKSKHKEVRFSLDRRGGMAAAQTGTDRRPSKLTQQSPNSQQQITHPPTRPVPITRIPVEGVPVDRQNQRRSSAALPDNLPQHPAHSLPIAELWSNTWLNEEGVVDFARFLSLDDPNGPSGSCRPTPFSATRTAVQTGGDGTVHQRPVSIGLGFTTGNERKLKKLRRTESQSRI